MAEPAVERKGLVVFAADHGVALEGVSERTQDMSRRETRQLLRGGTAAAVLCRRSGIEPLVANIGLKGPEEPGAVNMAVAEGTANLAQGPAMTDAQASAALEAGLRLAEECALRFDVVGLGMVGVGASTSASALLSALSGREAGETASRGPRLDDASYHRKLQAIRNGLIANQHERVSPFGALKSLGGLDTAAMTGFLLGAAARRLPVVLDGFESCAAALMARAFSPDSLDVMMFSHLTPDACHSLMLRFLAVEPVLRLEACEGGGFGAALAIEMLVTALDLFHGIREFGAP
jgi:nicotinate-nucleotide--dimethylbenzimidazole phosphoribosyltransferase